MDAFLIESWLEGASTLRILDAASAALAREKVREEGARAGLADAVVARMVNVVSELATNQLAHAAFGEIAVVPIARGGVPGLEIRAVDAGRGIRDPSAAFTPGRSTAGTLGIGLSAILELADEVDVDVRLEQGTSIRARGFGARVNRSREVGVLSVPHPDETISGDTALVHRAGDALTLVVIDGLGHGPEAREAGDLALHAMRGMLDAPLDALMHACHVALATSRGAAITIARVEAAEVHLAGIGNVAAAIAGRGALRRFTGAAGTVGAPGPLRRIAQETMPIAPAETLILHTDGVSTRATFDAIDDGASPPVVLAQRTIEAFSRGNDDALVVVAR